MCICVTFAVVKVKSIFTSSGICFLHCRRSFGRRGHQRYMCHECGRTYKQARSFIDHLQTHRPPAFECAFCGRLFSLKVGLQTADEKSTCLTIKIKYKQEIYQSIYQIESFKVVLCIEILKCKSDFCRNLKKSDSDSLIIMLSTAIALQKLADNFHSIIIAECVIGSIHFN